MKSKVKVNLGTKIIGNSVKEVVEKAANKMERNYNLEYKGVSPYRDLMDVRGVHAPIVYSEQFFFLDYQDGGVVDIFMYVYQRKDLKYCCHIKNMIYR